MIGRELIELLIDEGAGVTSVSLDDVDDMPSNIQNIKLDLREFSNCMKVCEGQQIVFHLAGIKGSPVATAKKPSSFFVPTIMFSLAMMEAARQNNVEWYLNTSSVGVYGPAEVFCEDQAWESLPSTHDRFAGWAKRICELQAEAYKIEYNWNCVTIVRPANVFGKFDSFEDDSAMVVPSLIKRALNGENPLQAWGDGSPVRDFIHARDVARGMMMLVEQKVMEPVNLGSGIGVSIRDLAETVAELTGTTVEWDKTKPNGDAKRLMDTKRAESYGFKPEISLAQGLRETILWYKENKDKPSGRYSAFVQD